MGTATSDLVSWLETTITGDLKAAKSGGTDRAACCDLREKIARCEAELAVLADLAEAQQFYDEHRAAPAGEVHGLFGAVRRIVSGYRYRSGFDPAWTPS